MVLLTLEEERCGSLWHRTAATRDVVTIPSSLAAVSNAGTDSRYTIPNPPEEIQQ